MPLRVVRRKQTGALTITGPDTLNPGKRIQQRAKSDDPKLAAEEAAALEAELLRTLWHGERRGSRSFAQALESYLGAEARSQSTKDSLCRILLALGRDLSLNEVDQQTAISLRRQLMGGRTVVTATGKTRVIPPATDASYRRHIVVPLKAVLNHAFELGWCDAPRLKAPRSDEGRTNFLYPEEAERFIAAANPLLQPLLIFLICTGARLSDALELDWREVDLNGARVIFWLTKGRKGHKKRRVVQLPPRAVAALANLPDRDGRVFRHRRGAYASNGRNGGGQIDTAWNGAARRAGLERGLRRHDLRHTWATWHYALNRDLLLLKVEGGWHSVTQVERYAHLMDAGYEADINRFHGCDERVTAAVAIQRNALI